MSELTSIIGAVASNLALYTRCSVAGCILPWSCHEKCWVSGVWVACSYEMEQKTYHRCFAITRR